MSHRFEGKNILVTGAGSGFGRRTAQRFAEEGANNLYLVDYNQDRLDATAPTIEERGGNPIKICSDLSKMENAATAVAAALEVDPKLDVLVSNAAAWVNEDFIEMKDDSWRRVLSVNLDAYYVLAQRAARAMKETGGGVILFTSSISSLGHGRGFTAYGWPRPASCRSPRGSRSNVRSTTSGRTALAPVRPTPNNPST